MILNGGMRVRITGLREKQRTIQRSQKTPRKNLQILSNFCKFALPRQGFIREDRETALQVLWERGVSPMLAGPPVQIREPPGNFWFQIGTSGGHGKSG